MNNSPSPLNLRFELLIWKNALEYNRRELSIFESYLLNLEGKIRPQQMTDFMTQLHDYFHSVEKLLAEIAADSDAPTDTMGTHHRLTNWQPSKPECRYIREELFYFEQNYHQFRSHFCTFAAGLDAA